MRGILVCPQLKVILLEEGKGLCREAAPPKKKTAWLVRKSMKIHFLVPFKTTIFPVCVPTWLVDSSLWVFSIHACNDDP